MYRYINVGKQIPVGKLLIRTFGPYGTHAYVVTKDGAIKLLANTKIMMKPIDNLYTNLISKQKVIAYGFAKDPFVQNELIDSEISLNAIPMHRLYDDQRCTKQIGLKK